MEGERAAARRPRRIDTPSIARARILLAGILAGPLPLAAQGDPVPTAPPSRASYRVERASSPIAVDGKLDEPAWQAATVIPLRFETRPAENAPPLVETECLLTYDEGSFYAAFRAHDPDPRAIVAHLTDRDTAFADDFVGVVLDTFNDERRAFEFFVNPLGVQMDLFQDDVSGNETETWDAIWESAGEIHETGYSVEIRIPWSSLRFPDGGSEQTWGLDALRFYPREHRHRMSSHPIDRNVSCYLCQATKITGFSGITPGRNLEFAPTLTASRNDSREDFPDGDLEEGSVESEVGLTARWGITPNLSLNAAANPDFSQVEADVAELAVNEQFALFFPEKRPFFLEGADFFASPLDVVFTRNVADPRWGAKLTGKVGASALGAFAAQDTVTNLLLPGNEASRATSLDLDTTDSVLRYRRDFGSNSALGALLTGREGEGYANTVGGFDGLWRPTESDALRVQVLGSRTEYPESVVAEFDQPAGAFDDWAGVVSWERTNRKWYLKARYEDIGSGFRADLGFLPKVDYTLLLGGVQRTWWGEEDDWHTRLDVGGDWDLTRDQDGELIEREVEGWINLQGPRQSFFQLGGGVRDHVFNGVRFDEHFAYTFVEASPTGDLYVSLFARMGDQIDFANTRLGEIVILEPFLRWSPGRHTRIQVSHDHQHLDVPGGRLFTADLSQLRLVYQLNLRTFVRAILQYTDIERRPDLYTFEVEPTTERLFSQLLFSFKLNPQTVLFVGYSDNSAATERIDLTREDQTFFVKLGYALVL